jgi:hypothetical protein
VYYSSVLNTILFETFPDPLSSKDATMKTIALVSTLLATAMMATPAVAASSDCEGEFMQENKVGRYFEYRCKHTLIIVLKFSVLPPNKSLPNFCAITDATIFSAIIIFLVQ